MEESSSVVEVMDVCIFMIEDHRNVQRLTYSLLFHNVIVSLSAKNNNRIFLQVPGHSCDINSVAFAADSSQILYSAGDDGLCKVS